MESLPVLYIVCGIQILLGVVLLCVRIPLPRVPGILVKCLGAFAVLAGILVLCIGKILAGSMAFG